MGSRDGRWDEPAHRDAAVATALEAATAARLAADRGTVETRVELARQRELAAHAAHDVALGLVAWLESAVDDDAGWGEALTMATDAAWMAAAQEVGE